MARVSAVFPHSTELHEAVKGSAKQQVSAFVALKAWRGRERDLESKMIAMDSKMEYASLRVFRFCVATSNQIY